MRETSVTRRAAHRGRPELAGRPRRAALPRRLRRGPRHRRPGRTRDAAGRTGRGVRPADGRRDRGPGGRPPHGAAQGA
ncbi:hypothetical protein LT493_02140 [Streptomyces tricolor]|nr:hypothetical protein [Streptomyces tricolor]